MPIWELKPTGVESPHWESSDYHGTAIVRAPDAATARRKANEEFAIAVQRKSTYQDSPELPWTNPELVTCEEIHDSAFDPDGPTAVLDPAGKS